MVGSTVTRKPDAHMYSITPFSLTPLEWMSHGVTGRSPKTTPTYAKIRAQLSGRL